MKNLVVIVDDDADTRAIVKELMNCIHVDVVAFADVENAMKYLENPQNVSRVRAVISDLMMAQKDGIDFLATLKAQPGLANIDFYLLTSADVSVFRSQLRPYKIKGIIAKPFDPDLFMQTFAAAGFGAKAA